MIQVHNLTVKIGSKRIIEELSFDIKSGEIAVILGKNGAGKSTLLETLSGSNKISDGSILWDGNDLEKISLKFIAQRRAVLSQSVNISFPITVHELVEMGTYVVTDNLNREAVNCTVKEALRNVEMEDFIDRTFNTLSGGEQKRILLAKCIAQLMVTEVPENKYLFLDEPTSSLDISQQHAFVELLKNLAREQNIGICAILHDINLAAIVADKLIMLKSGKLVAQGSPQEVLTSVLLKQTLDIDTILGVHPILDCPVVTAIPTFNEIHV